jgi:Asp-tRNA(Asn)/Glu-tRNA(Gln) amidotransferase A subunit family amidase
VRLDLVDRIEEARARFESWEPSIRAFLPEDGRFERLRRESLSLCDRYPHVDGRPPLFGVLIGVKDLFHVEGFTTRAGSRLPPSLLQGVEADSVLRLKRAGALVLGKTVTTEFAHSMPGPTRNPRNIGHTPGGSSSGSAAAVAAGLCEFALGTQTIGSIVRRAAFCGVVGLKPTFERISTSGVIPLAPSLDHVGLLATDVQMATRAARVSYKDWQDGVAQRGRPALGVPDGPYLEQLPADTSGWFDDACLALRDAGYQLRRISIMPDFDEVCARHQVILAAEAAGVHAAWFGEHEDLYGPKTAELIRRGQSIADQQLRAALRGRDTLRSEMRRLMVDSGIDAWIGPSALGAAPQGLESTGDPVMNLPWTQAGLPVIGLPAGHRNGLPMGLQVVGDWYGDESLLAWGEEIQQVLDPW